MGEYNPDLKAQMGFARGRHPLGIEQEWGPQTL